MLTEIRVPTIADAGPKLSIGRWFKRVGDPVTFGEPLVEIDTDNVTHEIRSPVTGVLSKILVKDGGSVEAGTALGTISQYRGEGIDHHLGNHLGAATDGKNANSCLRSLAAAA
jgi:pyruvate/2-oxoglutarate dehydrogenase complex dihydrolipoamide acyltransferase (E2) component